MSESNHRLTILEVYDSMPKTKGCETCNECFGEEKKDWCCKNYCIFLRLEEFKYLWAKVLEKKAKDPIWFNRVMRRIIEHETSGDTSGHGCTFYDGGCTIYKHRPWTCRVFGVGGPSKDCSHVESIGDPMSDIQYVSQHARFQDNCSLEEEDKSTPALCVKFFKKVLEGEFSMAIHGWMVLAVDFMMKGSNLKEGLSQADNWGEDVFTNPLDLAAGESDE